MMSRLLRRRAIQYFEFQKPLLRRRAGTFLSVTTRKYATQSNLRGTSGPTSGPTRKQITVVSDDGRIRWGDLSTREKAVRSTQQSFNFLVVLTGLVMTSGVCYFLYTEVFSSDSKTRHFNRAVDQVKGDRRCTELLGSSKKIRAFGEPSGNKWRRNRPIASTTQKDKSGTEHLRMHFNVEGPENSGVVQLHMIKKPGQNEFEYRYLALDVRGHSRIFLEKAKGISNGPKKGGTKMFGVQWR